MKVLRNDIQELSEEHVENIVWSLLSEKYFHFPASKEDIDNENYLIDNINGGITDILYYDCDYPAMWQKALINTMEENTVNVLEISSQGKEIIPQIMDKIFSSESQYVSFSINKPLVQELYRKTNALDISVLVMDEDLKLIPDYFGPGYFDLVIFQDSIQDIFQSFVFNKELQGEKIEYKVKKELLSLLYDCMDTMTQDGIMILSNSMFKMNLNPEYPCEFQYDILNMIRKWILESGLMLQEMEFEGFDKQWWMFLRKNKIRKLF